MGLRRAFIIGLLKNKGGRRRGGQRKQKRGTNPGSKTHVQGFQHRNIDTKKYKKLVPSRQPWKGATDSKQKGETDDSAIREWGTQNHAQSPEDFMG